MTISPQVGDELGLHSRFRPSWATECETDSKDKETKKQRMGEREEGRLKSKDE